MRIYNTLSRKIEEFFPIHKGEIRMYVCGITPYDYAHIGHARTAIFFDVVHRYFLYKGYKVKYVRNITDVDDKIINKAEKEGKTYKEIAEFYTKEYEKELEMLNVLKPWKEPKVSEHIPQIDKLIQKLKEKGYAYDIEDGTYFYVPAFKEYGKLSHQKLEELNKHRIEPNPHKKDVKDFALWKVAKKEDEKTGAVFEAGCCKKGRPGWHIECSAMSMHYLGETLDIHGGGKDLIFPHHENEIAQSEAATGKPFANYWMHVHFVNIKGEKMSKSLKNFVALKDALKKYSPLQIRLFLLSAHYRKDIDYNEKAMEDAEAKSQRINNFLKRLAYELWFIKNDAKEKLKGKTHVKTNVNKYIEKMLDALENDFHTEKAIASIFEYIEEFNKKIDEIEKNLEVYDYNSYAGFIQEFANAWNIINKIMGFCKKELKESYIPEDILLEIKKREKARQSKNYKEADAIRAMLKEREYDLLDAPNRTIILREDYGC